MDEFIQQLRAILAPMTILVCFVSGSTQAFAIDPRGFFATQRLSTASSVPGSRLLRVSRGSDRPEVKIKRDFEGTTSLPPNEISSLRKVSKKGDIKFRDFRNFGAQQPGAVDAPGAGGASGS